MMTKQKISDYFIELLKVLETKTSPEYPDWIFYTYEDKIYMEYDQKNGYLYLDDNKIWSVFETKLSLNDEEIQRITKDLVEEHLKLRVSTTYWVKIPLKVSVEEHLKLNGITTMK